MTHSAAAASRPGEQRRHRRYIAEGWRARIGDAICSVVDISIVGVRLAHPPDPKASGQCLAELPERGELTFLTPECEVIDVGEARRVRTAGGVATAYAYGEPHADWEATLIRAHTFQEMAPLEI